MKKILWLGIIFSFLFASHGFAAYSFTATTSGNTVTASLSGATGSTSSFQIVVQSIPFTTTTTSSKVAYSTTDPTIQKPNAQGVVNWSIPENSNTTYYVRATEIPVHVVGSTPYTSSVVTVKTAQVTLYFNHLTTTKQGNYLFVEGSIDTKKQPDYLTYRVYLTYSKSADLSNPIQVGLRSHTAGAEEAPYGISDGYNGDTTYDDTDPAGSYYWVLTGLTPGATYYMQQTIVRDAQNTVADRIDSFNADSGAIIAPAVPANASGGTGLNTNSYTLLSGGLPGLSVLPDPTVCAQQQADAIAKGKNPPLCSVNDLLNYALKLLIGISGVVLVLRLMYEGYQYMVTDVPFLKASSKSGFFTALTGLLLALSSYVILNTINPKLVNESINVQQLSIGITAPDTDTSPLIQNGAAPTSGPAGACTAGITAVTVQKSTFIACSTYNGIPIATNLRNMLTAAYSANITLQGGGFRTSAQQTQLRIAHCAGDLTTPNANCNPPTAPVGHSNHESGLAFDFTCNGVGNTIQSQDNICFKWLTANAATYGFKNFAKEPWHWSWDGR